jgi:hypothetical protein
MKGLLLVLYGLHPYGESGARYVGAILLASRFARAFYAAGIFRQRLSGNETTDAQGSAECRTIAFRRLRRQPALPDLSLGDADPGCPPHVHPVARCVPAFS